MILDNVTDDELINRVKLDDESAYKVLFKRHYKNVCYSAYKVVPDEHKSKDFAQEVFLDFWRRRENINVTSSAKAYFCRAAKYKAIDFIRARKLDFEETEIMDSDRQIDQNMTEYKELKNVIHKTVDLLPERCRVIFSLSRFDQMSHSEIAEQLGISKKTIENQITKALKTIRQSLLQYGLE